MPHDSPSPDPRSLADAARQGQFLTVMDRETAALRFRAALRLDPLGDEEIPLAAARGRVLAAEVVAEIDVPGFDRSNVDGFAIRSADAAGAMEEQPRVLTLTPDILHPGVVPTHVIGAGQATMIATGGMAPRGADAIVMVEETHVVDAPTNDGTVRIELTRAAAPGQNITFAGTDIARGETVLWRGQLLTARELGVLAALGRDSVCVRRRPRVAILSTGDEVVPAGQPLPLGCVYDSNAPTLAAAVEECGGEAVLLGAVPDDDATLEATLNQALEADCVLLSGGTSKGAGDISYRVVSRLTDPGIVAHGVALKPGKPVCLAATRGKPVVVLPGFPTSAIFTFHEFVAPVIRSLAGRPADQRATVPASLPARLNSDRGRTEYVLVGLSRSVDGWAAFPLGKGSGSVTTFSHADGFVTIPDRTEYLDAGSRVDVALLDRDLRPADLVVMGSHCVGLDRILSRVREAGFGAKSIFVGSQGGLTAATRGECDVAGVHLFDPQSGIYNRPFATPEVEWVRGYSRRQCLVFRADDPRFAGATSVEALRNALRDPALTMVNRNTGSGTRIVIDQLLDDIPLARGPERQRIAGYLLQPRSHNAVAAAVLHGRADWGVCIETVAREYGLATLPLVDEDYDFLIPRTRLERPAVRCFLETLGSLETRASLAEIGFIVDNH
ncbi:MAG: molybdopterin biosynthesis protein [Planctomyces sp.]|nr:molybdopterin biosynthesis protein [Planctomyces sp.]